MRDKFSLMAKSAHKENKSLEKIEETRQMNTKNLVLMALLVAVGAALYAIVPGFMMKFQRAMMKAQEYAISKIRQARTDTESLQRTKNCQY